MLLDDTSPEIFRALHEWHEFGRADFERNYPNLKYDEQAPKVAKTRKKYIALDRGGSGVYLVDRATGDVYSIKGYGVPNRKVGTLDSMIAFWQSRPTAWSAGR
jgi:hypothetical protein